MKNLVKFILLLILFTGTNNLLAQLPGCATSINVFPYTEGFETGLGNWNNIAGDNFDWTRDSGGTPSTATGPTTGSASTWYMYIETSSGAAGNEAWLESNCFDFSALTNPSISFDYHMYGAAMDSLELLISTNGTVWTSVWLLSTNQGNSWNTATVNLAAYSGQTVEFRFRGVRGTSFTGDAAIDNINIYDLLPMSVVSNTCTQASTANLEICATDAEIIRVEVITTGVLNPIDLTQLSIRTNGSTAPTADISNIDVYYTGTSNSFSSATLFGSAAPAVVGTNILINGTQTLTEGTNYFWIAYDINAAATITNIVDALCNQITVGGSNYVPTTTNPAGNRTLIDCARTCPSSASIFSDGYESGSPVTGVIPGTTYGTIWTGVPRTGTYHAWMNVIDGVSNVDVFERRFDNYYMGCDVTFDYWYWQNSIGFDVDYILLDDNNNVIDFHNVVTTAADINIYQNKVITFTPTTTGITLIIHSNSTGTAGFDIAIDDFNITQCCTASPLPVELLNFETKCENNTPSLNWSTATETNNDYFTIERSIDMKVFEEIATITGNGNSSSLLSYSWIDKNPPTQTCYYRLKQTDFNGDYEYLGTKAVDCNSSKNVSIYPNPTAKNIFIELGQVHQEIRVEVKNVIGQVLQLNNYKSIENIKLSLEGDAGIYFLTISNGNNKTIYNQKIVKQ
ncbi:MAG: BNR-repeat neuraminidase N-terminal domain-containing protein [Vicingaceae bacterium]|nr:BNR-repeat neuraminidase N-terminal domain-containing protein [Vicingaceae bacterium]